MSDFQKSVHRKDPADYDPIKVNPIEQDRKQKEEYLPLPLEASQPLLFAAVLTFFKKFLNPFADLATESIDTQPIVDRIIAFKALLEALSREDLSHNPEFAQKLSELWHNFLDDCNPIRSKEANLPKIIYKLKIFIHELSHYPPGEEHSLGFYFTSYAGTQWIPFPFMDMLRSLYQEALLSPTTSTLLKWIRLLDDLLPEPPKKEDQKEE